MRFHWNKPATTKIYAAMNYAWNKTSLKMNSAIDVQFARSNKRLSSLNSCVNILHGVEQSMQTSLVDSDMIKSRTV